MRDQGQLALKVDTKGLKRPDGSYLDLVIEPREELVVSLRPVTPGTADLHPIPAGNGQDGSVRRHLGRAARRDPTHSTVSVLRGDYA